MPALFVKERFRSIVHTPCCGAWATLHQPLASLLRMGRNRLSLFRPFVYSSFRPDDGAQHMVVTIGVISQKGGVGKSTVARLIAREFAQAGWNVKIADLD